jgi:hypothetical protein
MRQATTKSAKEMGMALYRRPDGLAGREEDRVIMTGEGYRRLKEMTEQTAVMKSALFSSRRDEAFVAAIPRTTGSKIMKAVMLHITGREMRNPAAPLAIRLLLASRERSETILSRLPVRRRYSASRAPPTITRASEENMRARPVDM